MRCLRPAAFGGDEDAEPVAPQTVDPRAERVDVTDDRIERRGGEHRRIGVVGNRQHQGGARLGVGEQTLERQREPWRMRGIGRAPSRGERGRERKLLVEELLGAVAEPAWFDDRDERARRQEIGEKVLLRRQPGQP